jgi:dTMP kinase
MLLEKGLLVVFEGIDGSGKTTQANLLFGALQKKGFDVIASKEPTDSIYGKKIKKLAKEERNLLNPDEEYQLFINDRKDHVENLIKPALEKKKIVILDRYYFSTIAYQGALGLDPKKIRKDNEIFAPTPEVVFLIHVPPELGLRRIQISRAETPDLFEKEEYLTKVAKIFDTLDDHYILRFDGANDIYLIHNEIMNAMDDILKYYMGKNTQLPLFTN